MWRRCHLPFAQMNQYCFRDDDEYYYFHHLKKIGLINNFYVQQLNKDYVLVKIKYLGRIDKIIKKLKDKKMNLELKNGTWQLSII